MVCPFVVNRNAMKQHHSSLSLIGMPGAGKSTVGVILAKLTSRDFIDTDILIQAVQHRSLQDIVDSDGHLALRKIEEDVILGLPPGNQVIATGGSAAYSEPAMAHLRTLGPIIFLDVDLPTLEARVKDFETRGLARRPDQTFADLFHERRTLYLRHAGITISCSTLTQEEVCARIIDATSTEK